MAQARKYNLVGLRRTSFLKISVKNFDFCFENNTVSVLSNYPQKTADLLSKKRARLDNLK